MIVIIFVLCVAIASIGSWLDANHNETVASCCAMICGTAGGIISFVAMVVLIANVSALLTIDNKIAMYQEENTNIERQIEGCVKQYQEYESGVFADASSESVITLVSLYPELKADALVAKQIEVYLGNNKKIKELKEQSIDGDVMRWWLYFGKPVRSDGKVY